MWEQGRPEYAQSGGNPYAPSILAKWGESDCESRDAPSMPNPRRNPWRACSLPRLCEARPARLGLRLNKSPMKVVTSDSPRLRNRPMKASTSDIRRSRDRSMKVIALTGDWNTIARAGSRVDHSSIQPLCLSAHCINHACFG